MILFKVALAWLAVAHHLLCHSSCASLCDSFQGHARLARRCSPSILSCFASQSLCFFSRSRSLGSPLLTINSVLLRKPIIVILFQVTTLAQLAVAHHQFCLASQANHCDSQQKSDSCLRIAWILSLKLFGVIRNGECAFAGMGSDDWGGMK